MVKEAVEHGGCDGGVAVEDGGPLFEGFICREHDGTPFVASADDLEEEIGTALVNGQVANFIEDEKCRCGVFTEFGFESTFGLSRMEGVDDINSVGEEHAESLLAGRVAQGGGKMGFAKTDQAQKDNVGFVVDELKSEEVLDLKAIDFFWPVPAEGFEGLDDRKAGVFDASCRGPIRAQVGFALDELGEVIEVRDRVFCGSCSKGATVFTEEGQTQVCQTGVELGDVVVGGFHG